MANGKSSEKAVAVRERKLPGMAWPEDFERFFERPFRGRRARRLWRMWPSLIREAAWVPEMDVFEREGKTVIRVDAPGMKREDMEVAVEGDMLEIRGKREEEKEVREEDYYCVERSTGEFSRAIKLPEGATAESIEATYTDGVLEVTVPHLAAEETKSVKIDVK
jgi:HSP20 family protein